MIFPVVNSATLVKVCISSYRILKYLFQLYMHLGRHVRATEGGHLSSEADINLLVSPMRVRMDLSGLNHVLV